MSNIIGFGNGFSVGEAQTCGNATMYRRPSMRAIDPRRSDVCANDAMPARSIKTADAKTNFVIEAIRM
jgi:hypothetical protein